MSTETEKIIPSALLISNIAGKQRPDFYLSSDPTRQVVLNDTPATVQSHSYEFNACGVQTNLFLFSDHHTLMGELWGFEEYKTGEARVTLYAPNASTIVFPEAEPGVIDYNRVVGTFRFKKEFCPGKTLLKVSDILREESEICQPEIFGDLDKVLKQLSKLAHALRQSTPSK